jgi:2-polyprenyl-3-methyl-5-hydroxy-6-metoxy-1,4-benzoquinol methylase
MASLSTELATGETPSGVERVPCALCGGDDFDPLYQSCPDRRQWSGRFTVVRCRGCRLAQTSPRPTREAMGSYYSDGYVSFSRREPTRPRSLPGVLKMVVGLPHSLRWRPDPWPLYATRSGRRVLDVGCGAGMLLEELARCGWEPWGIEPNRELAQSVAEGLDVPHQRIVAAQAEEAILPNDSFDLVTMAHVLEHLHDPREVLGKIRGWLHRDGMLRIWVPNIASLESRMLGHLWFGLDLPRHLYHFDPTTISRLLDAAGFTVERLVPEFQASSLAGSVTQVADSILGRRRQYRHSRALYCATLPVASLLCALGNTAILSVTARRRG